jgi:cysteine desulfurase
MHGAGHECGRRAGTESAFLATGLGAACSLAMSADRNHDIQRLRDRFWSELRAAFGDQVVLNGHPTFRLPNTLNVSFIGRIGADILARLDGVAASTGSACHAGRFEHSPVLTAMAVPPDLRMGAIRFSLGRTTTQDEIDIVTGRLRKLLPMTNAAA